MAVRTRRLVGIVCDNFIYTDVQISAST